MLEKIKTFELQPAELKNAAKDILVGPFSQTLILLGQKTDNKRRPYEIIGQALQIPEAIFPAWLTVSMLPEYTTADVGKIIIATYGFRAGIGLYIRTLNHVINRLEWLVKDVEKRLTHIEHKPNHHLLENHEPLPPSDDASPEQIVAYKTEVLRQASTPTPLKQRAKLVK